MTFRNIEIWLINIKNTFKNTNGFKVEKLLFLKSREYGLADLERKSKSSLQLRLLRNSIKERY